MADDKFIAVARSLTAAKAAKPVISSSLSEEQALLAAIEIVEALTEAGLTAEDFLDDVFQIHPFWQVASASKLH